MSYACLMPEKQLRVRRSEIQLRCAEEKCSFESCLQMACYTERVMTRYPDPQGQG